MKKTFATLVLGAMLVGSLTACSKTEETKSEAPAAVSYTDGTYEGESTGNNGAIKVSVTVTDGKIADIKVTEQAETEAIFATAEEPVISAIIEKQTTEVDAVASATMSSNGIKNAVKAALETASK